MILTKLNKKAFSLIEILLIIALMGAVLLIGIPLGQTALTGSEIDTAYEVGLKSLRLAQAKSQGGYEDSTWGVRFQQPNIIIFKGSSFQTRDASYDVKTVLGAKVGYSGINEVYFSKIEGIPSVTGSINIFSYEKSRVIQINSNGLMY